MKETNGFVLGIIGGSGLYGVPEIVVDDEVVVSTPFGAPSSPVVKGHIGSLSCLFLARHGKGHVKTPSEVNYRANVWALKTLGAQALVSVSAVGSLRAEIAPGDLVIPDQVIDKTAGRPQTFFGNGLVGHVAMADPYCPSLSALVATAAEKTGATVHRGGTLVCMEGPAFSTRAESLLHRAWGAHLIGMTVMPEAKLAREARLCYCTLALATDYDCWHPDHESVTVEQVIAVMHKNTSRSRETLVHLASTLGTGKPCHCKHSLDTAVITSPEARSDEVNERLRILMD